jgi:hypothetical protein
MQSPATPAFNGNGAEALHSNVNEIFELTAALVIRFRRTHMKTTIAFGIAFSCMAAGLLAQTIPNTVDAHIAAARAAAGTDHVAVFNSLCMATEERASFEPCADAGRDAGSVPDRAKWHTEPMKVFDNPVPYYLGNPRTQLGRHDVCRPSSSSMRCSILSGDRNRQRSQQARSRPEKHQVRDRQPCAQRPCRRRGSCCRIASGRTY